MILCIKASFLGHHPAVLFHHLTLDFLQWTVLDVHTHLVVQADLEMVWCWLKMSLLSLVDSLVMVYQTSLQIDIPILSISNITININFQFSKQVWVAKTLNLIDDKDNGDKFF